MKNFSIAVISVLALISVLTACQPILPEPVTDATTQEVMDEKVSVTFSSSIHSADLSGYAWIQEFLSSNDMDAANAVSLSESAREGAVCYASIAPSVESTPSASDGAFSVTFDAEPGSTFHILCDADATHPGAIGMDVFTVPDGGGEIDHAIGIFTPELGVTNDLVAKAAGYIDAEEMFQSAGTCRVLALPTEGATISVQDASAYGFYMEAPDTAGRLTALEDPSRFGAYVVLKEFAAGEEEADIDIDFSDTSGAGLTWATTTCPIRRGFSTYLEVPPIAQAEVAPSPSPIVIERVGDVPRIPLDEAKEHFDNGTAIFVDSRGKYEYDQAHIADAILLTTAMVRVQNKAGTLENQLPKDQLIIAYCT